jgi:hypothetical protein
MKRAKIVEDAFAIELDALNRGLIYLVSGDSSSTRTGLYRVLSRYVDELNKVRKYACPLSTNMLLSSILEAVLLVQILEHSGDASKTTIWMKAAEETFKLGKRKAARPELPMLTLAELIQIADELKLLRTSGVQQKVDLMILKDLPASLREHILLSSWDAKRNHEVLHNLRSVRNSVHPMEMIGRDSGRTYDEYEIVIWRGLRLLLLLNVMLGIESPLNSEKLLKDV